MYHGAGLLRLSDGSVFEGKFEANYLVNGMSKTNRPPPRAFAHISTHTHMHTMTFSIIPCRSFRYCAFVCFSYHHSLTFFLLFIQSTNHPLTDWPQARSLTPTYPGIAARWLSTGRTATAASCNWLSPTLIRTLWVMWVSGAMV
jgi:hypothetical protein